MARGKRETEETEDNAIIEGLAFKWLRNQHQRLWGSLRGLSPTRKSFRLTRSHATTHARSTQGRSPRRRPYYVLGSLGASGFAFGVDFGFAVDLHWICIGVHQICMSIHRFCIVFALKWHCISIVIALAFS